MDLRQLQYFVAIAEEGSFLAASRRLHLSQPALSKRIQELEADVALPLLNRHSRGVELTAAGRELLARAYSILDAVDDTRKALARFREQPTLIRLGITPATVTSMLPRIIERCAALERPIHLDVQQRSTQEVLDLVLSGSLDAAMSFDLPEHPSRFEIVPLHNEDLMLIGPPVVVDHAAGDIPLRQLTHFPLILGPLTELTRHGISVATARAGITLDVRNHIQPIAVRKSLMIENGYCSIMLFSSLAQEIWNGDLAARRIIEPTLSVTLYLVMRTKEILPDIRASFATIVKQVSDQAMRETSLPWYPCSSSLR